MHCIWRKMPGIRNQIGFQRSQESCGSQTVSTGLEVRARSPQQLPAPRTSPWDASGYRGEEEEEEGAVGPGSPAEV